MDRLYLLRISSGIRFFLIRELWTSRKLAHCPSTNCQRVHRMDDNTQSVIVVVAIMVQVVQVVQVLCFV